MLQFSDQDIHQYFVSCPCVLVGAGVKHAGRIPLLCREAKKPEAILSSDAFSFMKNNCGDDKFVVIELSQRVKLTSLEITMIELYSSRARTIDLYSSLTKPPRATESPWLLGDWTYYATVKAENKKGEHVRCSPTSNTPCCDDCTWRCQIEHLMCC
jgi:hypothetical protein